MIKVFVYGTLLSGEGNHRLLSGATLVSEGILSGWTLHTLHGGFPGATRGEPSDYVVGEVYEVDESELNRLDGLEGYPTHYDRELVSIQTSNERLHGVWVYSYQPEPYGDRVCDWKAWNREKRTTARLSRARI